MRVFIYKMCRKLYMGGVLPWRIWSPVYDRWHRLVKK